MRAKLGEIGRDCAESRANDFRRGLLDAGDRRLFSQVQGRTYANMFGLVERFINAKVLELTEHHRLDDQNALEASVRFSQEELKHQELFRRGNAGGRRLFTCTKRRRAGGSQ